ncbi:MAG: hypothetical protein NC033_06085 [Clostridiales bacterium]|nr:hypothetical protein [Clostridiales bacterium]
MRWTKRLKWIRASKIIIPIALAISLVFAGFSVYAKEAEYFVLRINNDDGVNLALTMNRDLSEQTPRLRVPINAGYEDATWTPDSQLIYEKNNYYSNLPDDIAKYDGEHSVYERRGAYSFFSFSFWVVNNSSRSVDIDMKFNIDSMTIGANNHTDNHIDDAVRIMIIEGEPLLSEQSYTIYKKAEKTEEAENQLTNRLIGEKGYDNSKSIQFENDSCVFNRSGILGFPNVREGETLRFTVVVWLEGWDNECTDDILSDSLRMSIDFNGR